MVWNPALKGPTTVIVGPQGPPGTPGAGVEAATLTQGGSVLKTAYNVRDYGAVTAAVSDAQMTRNLAAIHAVRDLLRADGTGTLLLPGQVQVNGTVDLTWHPGASWSAVCPFSVVGLGGLDGTAGITYAGAGTVTSVVDLTGTKQSIWRDITIGGGGKALFGLVCARWNNDRANTAGKHSFTHVAAFDCLIASHLNYASEENTYTKCQFQRSPIGCLVTGYPLDLTQDGNGVYNITKTGHAPCLSYNSQFMNTAGGTSQVEVITLTGSPSGGTFSLVNGVSATGAIPYNADAPTVQAALAALDTIRGTANIAVSGAAGGPWTVTRQNTLRNRSWTVMSGYAANLTGGSSPAVQVAIQTAGVSGQGDWTDSTNHNFYNCAFGSSFGSAPSGSSRCGLMIQGAQAKLFGGVIQSVSGAEAGLILDGTHQALTLDSVDFDSGLPLIALKCGAYAPVDIYNVNHVVATGGHWTINSASGTAYIDATNMRAASLSGMTVTGGMTGAGIILRASSQYNVLQNVHASDGTPVAVSEVGPSANTNMSLDKNGVTLLAGSPTILPVVTALLSGSTLGSVRVDYPGSGVALDPTVVLTGGSPTVAATCTATASGGGVASVTVATPGSGYQNAPTVTFTGGRQPATVITAAAAVLTLTNLITLGGLAVGRGTLDSASQAVIQHTYADDLASYNDLLINVFKSVAGSNRLHGIDISSVASLTTGIQATVRGIAARANLQGAGTLTLADALYARIASTAGGPITTAHGLFVDTPSLSGGGTIGTNYGVYVATQIAAAATTFALFTVGGEVRHQTGDAATIGLSVRGAASQSANLQEWQGSTGTVLASMSAAGAFTAATIDATKLTGAVPPASLPAPAAHATTHEPGGADRVYYDKGNGHSDVLETIRRIDAQANFVMATGALYLVAFTAEYALTASQVLIVQGSTAISLVTYAALGLYTLDGSDNATLVRQTGDLHATAIPASNSVSGSTSNITFWSQISTIYACTLKDSAGTNASTYAFVRGSRYALGLLVVATTAGSCRGVSSGAAMLHWFNAVTFNGTAGIFLPYVGKTVGSQASLPSGVTVGTGGATSFLPYAAFAV